MWLFRVDNRYNTLNITDLLLTLTTFTRSKMFLINIIKTNTL